MKKKIKSLNPRINVVQKIYSSNFNPDEKIIYSKNRYKKFIKDVVEGTIERSELIEGTLQDNLKDDLDLKKTDKILKIIIFAAVYELMFMHRIPIKVVISEYLKVSEFFITKSQIHYLNAILDKLSKIIRLDK